jgi:hypothetical protein
MAVGWAGAIFVVVGLRRQRPPDAAAWYVLAAGVFLNATGLVVEALLEKWHMPTNPSVADLFFLAIFPALIIGLGALVWRRSASEDSLWLLLHTLVCALVAAAMAIVAWEFIVWQTHTDPNLSLPSRVIVTVYPLGDLIVLALLLRLVFAGGARNVAFLLVMISLCFFLGADVGWAAVVRRGTGLSPELKRVLEMASMMAFALVGAAALHPAIQAITRTEEAAHPGPAPLRWVALIVSIITAPLVLLTQALLDHWYTVSSF